MAKVLTISIIVLCQIFNCYSQVNYHPKPQHPEWFKAIPMIDEQTPAWAKLMYTDDSNFDAIIKARDTYYATNKFVKNIHTQNFKYWYKKVYNHVNEQGIVNKRSESDLFKNYERQKTIEESGRSMDIWTCVGPTRPMTQGQLQ
jgi:hypothetical protein